MNIRSVIVVTGVVVTCALFGIGCAMVLPWSSAIVVSIIGGSTIGMLWALHSYKFREPLDRVKTKY